MKNQNKRNVAESIRARLLKISKKRGEDFDYTLLKYATERFLYRLSKSEYNDKLILKGALLLTVVLKDSPYRVTRDIDFLGRASNSPEMIFKMLEAICQIEHETDGMTFDHTTIKIIETQEANQYQGLRAKFLAFLGTARINMQIDVGFGDRLHPAPAILDYPVLLNHEVPKIFSYPLVSVLAEKIEAIISIGMVTSRLKDFFDIYIIAERFELSGDLLHTAVKSTFKNRNTPIPINEPEVLSPVVVHDSTKRAQWNAFLRRNNLDTHALDFEKIVSVVNQLTSVLWDLSLQKKGCTWKPGIGWATSGPK